MLSPVESIFGLLLDRSAEKAPFAGRDLPQIMGEWAVHGSSVLVRVAPSPRAGAGGWILVESGYPTSAWTRQHAAAAEALAFLYAQAPGGWCQAAFLGPEERLLAHAVSHGTTVAFRQPVTPQDRDLLPLLGGRNYAGVLLVERAFDLRIWSDRAQGWLGSPAWPAEPGGYHKSLFRWAAPEEPRGLQVFLDRERRSTSSLWAALERELHAELDDRAPRLLAWLRREHGRDDVSTLLHHLMPHLERVTGADAAHRFRQRFLREWLEEP